MKKLFRFLIVLIILTPVLLVVLMLDGSKPPVEVYQAQSTSNFSLQERLSQSLDHALSNASENDFDFSLTEDEINMLIYEQLLGLNENYLKDDTEANQYFMEMAGLLGAAGAWSTLDKDTFTIKLRADLLKPFKIKSSITLKFKLIFSEESDPNILTLSLEKIKIGRLGIPKKATNWVLNAVNLDLKGIVENLLILNEKSIGTFEVETWTLKIDKISLIQTLFGQDEEGQILSTLAKVLISNELIDLKFEKEKVKGSFKLSELYSDEDLFVVPEILKIETENELTALLEQKTTSLIMSGLVSSENELYVSLTEMDLNRILGYYFKDMGNNFESLELGEDVFLLTINAPSIKIKENLLQLSIKIEMSNQDDPTKKFITVLAIDLNAIQIDNNLALTLGGLSIGSNIHLSETETTDLLSIFGANDLISDNMMVISDFLTSFSTDQIQTKEITAQEGYLMLVFEGQDEQIGQILNHVRDEILDSLEDVVGNHPEIQDAYDDLMTALDEGDISPTVIQEFLDELSETLTPTELEQFTQELIDSIGDLEDIIPSGFTP